MKATGRCPKCRSTGVGSFHDGQLSTTYPKLVRKTRQRERATENLLRRSNRNKADDLRDRIDQLEAEITSLKMQLSFVRYACSQCGYSEHYLAKPEEFSGDQELREFVGWRWSAASGEGPYR